MKVKEFLGIIWLILILLTASHVCAWWTSDVLESKNYAWDEYPEERAIAIGADGTIHIVYQVGPRIIHAYKDGLLWHKEIAAEWGGSNLSIAIDAEDKVHLSFCSSGSEGAHYTNSIHYATNSAGAWATETVKSENSPNGRAGISNVLLDSNDNPHLIYVTGPPDIEHAYKDSTGWHSETLSADSEYGEYRYLIFSISLALDSNDNPHLIYQPIRDSTYLRYTYAYKDKGGWHFEDIDELRFIGASIFLDSNDNPIIGNGFFLAHKDSTGWHFEQFVDPEANSGLCNVNSIAIDPQDNLHMSYRCSSYVSESCALKYAKGVGSEWHREIVDRAESYEFPPFIIPGLTWFIYFFGSDIGYDSAIAVDPLGQPHIVYTKNWFQGICSVFIWGSPDPEMGIVNLKHATGLGFSN
jgi:hypothetical protein